MSHDYERTEITPNDERDAKHMQRINIKRPDVCEKMCQLLVHGDMFADLQLATPSDKSSHTKNRQNGPLTNTSFDNTQGSDKKESGGNGSDNRDGIVTDKAMITRLEALDGDDDRDHVDPKLDQCEPDNTPTIAAVDTHTYHRAQGEECSQEPMVHTHDNNGDTDGDNPSNILPLGGTQNSDKHVLSANLVMPCSDSQAHLNRMEPPDNDGHGTERMLGIKEDIAINNSFAHHVFNDDCAVNLRNMNDLHKAIIEGNMRRMIQCAEKGIDLDGRFEMDLDTDVVCILNESSYPEDIRISATPLHVAVTKGNADMTQALLNAGCNADAHVVILREAEEGVIIETEDGTSLHIAIHLGHTAIVEILLQQVRHGGCDVNSKTASGAQPLHLAICNGLDDTAEALIRLGCDVTTHYHCDIMGRRTPIQLAADVGHARTIEALMKTRKIKDVNEACPDTGKNPLHMAMQSRNDEAAIKLLQYGARWDKEDFDGMKPVDYASKDSPVHVFLFKTILESHNSVTLKGRVPRNLQRTQTDSEKLKMVGTVKGMCFIVNNNEFQDGTSRQGTLTDEERMRKMFTELGFLVVVFRDLKKKQMENAFTLAQKYDHSEHEYFFCVVLSHGKSGEFYGVDMEPMKMQTFSTLLQKDHCPSLAKKPKVLIVQACQGTRDDTAVGTTDRPLETDASPGCDEDTKWFPTEENFVFYSSTLPGYVSYRDSDGSTFIKRFVSRIQRIAYNSCVKFSDIVEDVNRDMAENPEEVGRQVPIYMTTAGTLHLCRILDKENISNM